MIYWNIEAPGSEPQVISAELNELGAADIVALSGVNQPKVFVESLNKKFYNRYSFLVGHSGQFQQRLNERPFLGFNRNRFTAISPRRTSRVRKNTS